MMLGVADRVYLEAFFMTFKSFTTLSELVDLLIARYRIQPPDGLKPEEHDEWVKLKQNIIQLRYVLLSSNFFVLVLMHM